MKEIIFVFEVLDSLLLTGVPDHRLMVKTLFMERERRGRRSGEIFVKGEGREDEWGTRGTGNPENPH